MGTTVVACYRLGETRVCIAHVGDSRAYLLRDGQLRLLTRDHTVVAELLARGVLSAEDALHHPYKSVLSRNLGGKPEALVDLLELELTPGDRVLLCSDGLPGYSSHDAMEQLAGGAEDPERAVADLLDLALRGGGGDNVTALVIEAGSARIAPTTQVVRTTGALAWWSRRELFLAEARRRDVARSPICARLPAEESIDLVAGNLCQALFHDLSHATGINVWTFAENLARGWLEQDGDYGAIRDLLDAMRAAAEAVIANLHDSKESWALRALLVAELAVAGAVAEHTRAIETELLQRTTLVTEAATFTGEKTMPFLETDGGDVASPTVRHCLDRAYAVAQGRLEQVAARRQSPDCLRSAHLAAIDSGADADMLPPARDLYGSRLLVETAVAPLLDSLDEARRTHLDSVIGLDMDDGLRIAALRRVAGVHRGMATAISMLVADACQPISDALRLSAEETASLRARVGRGEAQIAELERKLSVSKRLRLRALGLEENIP
jgi:hypothetical protein